MTRLELWYVNENEQTMLSCSIIHLSLHVFWIIYLSLHISCSIIYLSLHTCILDLCLHSHIAPCMHVTSIFGCSGPSFCYRYFAQCGFLTVALKDCLAFGATEFMLILSSHGGGHQGFGGDENTGRRHLLQANHDIQLVNFVLSCTCNFLRLSMGSQPTSQCFNKCMFSSNNHRIIYSRIIYSSFVHVCRH